MSNSDLKHLVGDRPRFTWVERFTGVFAFLNIVVVSIFSATCVGFLGIMILSQIFSVHNKDAELLWYLCLACCVTTITAFVFAAVLFHGMYQKKPSYVLAYFIFGVTINIAALYGIMVLQDVVLKLDKNFQDMYNYYFNFNVAVAFSAVYSAVLCMVGWAYILMRFRRYKPIQY